MDDLRTRAQLVDFDRAGAIGTVVTRAEIAEAAAGAEFPATLVLDLDKVEAADAGEVTAHAKVAVDWDKETLERLLASTEDEEIGLWFDERELARAFEQPEVEAHGLRERAAVLAVAAAAVGTTASPALARFPADAGGAGGGSARAGSSVKPATGVPSVPIGGAERALAQDEKLTAGMSQGTTGRAHPAAAAHQAIPIGGAERALAQDEKLTQGLEPGQPAVTASSGGTTLSTGELAAAVAGGVLLISGAGFGASRRRTPPAQPA